MPLVLICADAALPEDLQKTLLWRDDVQRETARTVDDALARGPSILPRLVLVDGALAEAERLIAGLRADPGTRSVSIAVLARGEFDPAELGLLSAGANAILRLPVGGDWDDRLAVLMSVAPRRAARLAVTLQYEGSTDEILTVGGTVLNLSERGMLVETDVPLAVGTDMDFKIRIQGSPQPLVGCGQVVRQHGSNQSGVHFYGLEADGLDRIRRFVNT